MTATTKPSLRQNELSLAVLVAAMVSIQVGASLAKQLFPLIGPGAAASLRLMLAAAILMVVFRPWRRPVGRKDMLWIGAYGAALGAMNLCFYLAINTIPLGVAVALEFLGPLAIALFGSRRPLDLLWIGLAAVGVGLLTPFARTGALDPSGVMLAIAAGGFWALYILFGQKAGAELGGQATAYGMAVAALVAAPIGLATATGPVLVMTVLPITLAVAILSSAIPYSLEMFALRRLPARTFGLLMSMEPAIAVLAGFAVLGERLTIWQGVAIACVIGASAGATLGIGSKKKA